MATLISNVRHALRLLLARPGFSIVAILTLAIGIGATTAIFTVVNAVLLRPLPFPHPDRLVEVYITSSEGPKLSLPDTDFLAWRSANTTCDAVAVFNTDAVNLTGDGGPERLSAVNVTDQFFAALQVQPAIGRVFQRGDDRPGAPKTVVLSHAFWRRRFHSDASLVGRSISLSGVPHTVVGVMPQAFGFPSNTIDVWRIHTTDPPTRRGPFYTWGIARLKPGVSLEQTGTNLRAVATTLRAQYPSSDDWRFTVVPLQEALVGNVRRILLVLLGSVGVLLLIATANVANLLLARAASRDREMAVRGALGAGVSRIVAQLITESLVLAAAAAMLGLMIAVLGTRALLAIAPDGIPRLDEVRMSVPVFLFAVSAALICGVAFSLAPALRASRTPLVETLKDGRSGSASAGHRRTQRVLVVAEIALAIVLSVGAGLMIRSFAALERVNPGFSPDHLLTFEIALPSARYDDQRKVSAFYDGLVVRLEALPGVRSAATTISLPPNLLYATDNFMVDGQVLGRGQSAPIGPFLLVSDRFFTSLGVPLTQGRFFDARETPDSPPVAIVNETLAKKYFPRGDAVGRRIKDGGPERPVGPNNPWMTIVGVVGDLKYDGLETTPEPAFYMPLRQNAWDRQYVVVRTVGDPQAVASSARTAVASLDPDIPIFNVKTMDTLMAESVASPRFRTTLVAIFAGIGLLLAVIGTYGVMAYAVADRTHELGVRAALGASRRDLLALVLGEAGALIAAGLAAGIAGALFAARVIGTLLFGVEPTDPATFIGVCALLAATALVASYIPARRAMKVDPMVALRYE